MLFRSPIVHVCDAAFQFGSSCGNFLRSTVNTELSVISVAVKIDIMLWNSLPEIVISADTTDTFKLRLDKFWQHQDILYDYKVELTGVGNRSQINADDNVVRVFTIRSISRLPVVRFAIARLRNHLEIGCSTGKCGCQQNGLRRY